MTEIQQLKGRKWFSFPFLLSWLFCSQLVTGISTGACLVQSSFCLAVALEVCKISTIIFSVTSHCVSGHPQPLVFCMVYSRIMVALLQVLHQFLHWQKLAFSGCHSLIQHNLLQKDLVWLSAKQPACQTSETRYIRVLWNFSCWRFSRAIRRMEVENA